MIGDIAFGVAGLATLVASVCVVQSRNLIHAVLWLAVALAGTAVLFGMLGAPFLAGVQVLTYIGGVVTLLIFGVMVTRRHEGGVVIADHVEPVRGLIVAGGLTVVLWAALWNTPIPTQDSPIASANDIGHSLLGAHLIAFEVASVLLLSAIIGAVAIARRRDPDPETGTEPSSLAAVTTGAQP